jgi:hypothetical protein
MFVRDEAAIIRDVSGQAKEKELQPVLDKIQEVSATARILDDPDLNPTDYERQLGRWLTHEEIERRLTKINPRLVFLPHPKNPTKRVIYVKEPTGKLEQVMVCEAGKVPENSVMDRVYRDTLDPDTLKPGYVLDRKDVPKSEYIPHKFNPDGSLKELGRIEFGQGTLMPGFNRKIVPYAEVQRGYRTVLELLILSKLITEAEADREFGTQNKAAWAAVLGKTEKKTPW